MMRPSIIFLLVLGSQLSFGIENAQKEGGADFVLAEDPYDSLTSAVRSDWARAIERIQKNDREGLKAHIVHPEFSLVLFDGMRSLVTRFPDALQKLAIIGYTRPQRDASIRDVFVCAGPFRVESSANVRYATLEEGRFIEFSLEPERDYYLYVQLTNETEEDEEEVPNSVKYRFQTPVLPQTLEECTANVIPLKAQLGLGDKDYHMYAFNQQGDAILQLILKAWTVE